MCAWCLRWSATQAITGPCTAIEPREAKTYSVGLWVRKERWVSIRWKPTVIPAAVSTYITANRTRSCQLTTLPQSSTIAARVATKGTTMAPRFTTLLARVM